MNHALIRLENLMVQLSHKYFGVEWADGLEYALWHWLEEGVHLHVHDRYQLYQASLAAKAWITKTNNQRRHVEIEVWRLHFESGEW